MNKITTLLKSFIVVLILGINARSQENFISLFPEKELVWGENFSKSVTQVNLIDKNMVVLLREDPLYSSKGEMVIYNQEGEFIKRKEYRSVQELSTSTSGNKIFVPFRRIDPNLKYYEEIYDAEIFDSSGNKISEIQNISSPHAMISDNGRYAITTRVGGAEDRGKFEIFNIETGQKLKIQFRYKYQFFFAQFLSDNKIIILLQRYETVRDEKTGKKLSSNAKPTMLIIYDIESNNILKEKEINAINGNPFWLNRFNETICVSDNGKYIAIAGYNQPWQKKRSRQPYVLLLLDEIGNIIFEQVFDSEKDRREGINNSKFIDDRYLLTLKHGVEQSKLIVYNAELNKEVWRYTLGKGYFAKKIRDAYLDKEKNHLLVNLNGIWKFRLNDGELLNRNTKLKILHINDKSSTIIIENDRNLKLLK